MDKKKINSFRRNLMQRMTRHIGRTFSMLPDKVNPTGKIQTILVVRPNNRLGNQLMLTPLLREIEECLPGAQVDLFVRGNLAPVIFHNYTSVNRFIKLPPKPFKQLIAYLRIWISLLFQSYDLVFNVDGGSSSGRLATKLVRGKIKHFGDIHNNLSPVESSHHMGQWPVHNFRFILSHFQHGTAEKRTRYLSLLLNNEEKQRGEMALNQLTNNTRPTIMFYTFATGSKCLSKEWWSLFYTHLKNRYAETYNLVEVLPKENVSQIDFAATNYYSTDIREMGAVIGQASIFITGDCGIMHLASSVNTPTVALFSASDINMYKPYNPGSIALDALTITTDQLLTTIDKILSERDSLTNT